MDLSEMARAPATFSGCLELREAQSLLGMATSMGRLGAWSVALDTMDLHWSDEVRAIHEVPDGFECRVEDAIRFYAPWARPVVAEAFRRCAEEGRPYDLELQLVTARGKWIWVRAIGEAERGAGGRIVSVRGAFQDITRSKAQSERSRKLAERLTMTLGSLTDGFFILDREWRFTYVNPPAEKVLHCSRHQLIGRSIWQQFPEAVGSTFHREYRRAMETNEPVEFEECYEPLGLWARVRAFPSPQGLAVSFRDFTAQVEAQREVLRLNAELERRVAQRTRQLQDGACDLEAISYAVAHDLRSPLAAICGFAQAIAETEGQALSPRGQRHLSRIIAAGRQLDAMTDGLLGLARLSNSALRPAPVDIAQIAREVAALLEETGQRPVEFVAPANLPATGDAVLLTQVMQNLLVNAWKFTAGGDHPKVEVFAHALQDGCTAYCVRDNGVGFEMSQASRLFGAFERLHSSAEYPGTGIGLAIVRKIIERHGGRVWAESSPGNGASFFFTLAGDGGCRAAAGS
jgi:PAS domain S-box-containing protein